jgi:hypothetical protein
MGSLKVLPAHWARVKAADERRAEREKREWDWQQLQWRIEREKRESEFFVQSVRGSEEPLPPRWWQKMMGAA